MSGYVFHLRFYELLQRSLMVLTVLTLAMVPRNYGYLGLLRARDSRMTARNSRNVCVLLPILVADWGLGLYLDRYELVYSTLGVVYGAGYTADHVTRIVLWIMIAVLAVACSLLGVSNIMRKEIELGSSSTKRYLP